MAQSPFEVVRRAIEFDHPDRLPMLFDSMGLTDVAGVSWNQIGTGDKQFRETLDEWGCLWRRSEMQNMGQVKGHPLADWSALGAYRWPDPHDPKFFDGFERKFEKVGDKYVTTGIFMLLFERMHSLHGFEATLADLYLDRERMEFLADRIVEFDLGIIEETARRAKGRIHGFSFTDDWGTERATFVSPAFWDGFFKRRYQRVFDACHAAGWHVWMHSCGKVNEIIEGLIEIGLDVINLQQPRALGIEEIGRRFRGRICFSSLCDIQATLPKGDLRAIRDEAKLLIDQWSTEAGGFLLSDYGDGAAIGVPLETKQLMLDAFRAADRWRAANGK